MNHAPTATPLASGLAMTFNGTSSTISVPSSASLNITNAITIEAWVKANALATENGIAGTWDDLAGANRSYLLWIANGSLRFDISHTGADSASASAPFPTDGLWHHVAGAFDGASVTLYLDGTAAAATASPGVIATNARPFYIGRTDSGGNSSDYFNGEIDEVRVWNIARTPTQVATDRNKRLLGTETRLAGYWSFDLYDGQTLNWNAMDETANGNDGTLAGTVPPVRIASTASIDGAPISLLWQTGGTLTLAGVDADNDALTATVTTLPASGQLYQTPDGATWGAAITTANTPVTNANKQVIYSPNNRGSESFTYVVNDGIFDSIPATVTVNSRELGSTWAAQSSGTTNTLWNVTWGNNQFVAVGAVDATSGLATILTSPDGRIWTQRTSGTASILYSVVWNGTLFVAVGAGGAILNSTDGINWTAAASSGVVTANTLYSVVWAPGTGVPGQFVAVGAAGAIVTSTDGNNWAGAADNGMFAVNLYGLTWSGAYFVAVGAGGTIISSADGSAWAPQASGTTGVLESVAYRLGLFVTVGAGGTIMTSTGPTQLSGQWVWTKRTSGTTNGLFGVVADFNAGLFAVGAAGTVLQSQNLGSTWTAGVSNTGNVLNKATLIGAGREMIAVGAGGTILVSP
jgi:hypothetical protein